MLWGRGRGDSGWTEMPETEKGVRGALGDAVGCLISKGLSIFLKLVVGGHWDRLPLVLGKNCGTDSQQRG